MYFPVSHDQFVTVAYLASDRDLDSLPSEKEGDFFFLRDDEQAGFALNRNQVVAMFAPSGSLPELVQAACSKLKAIGYYAPMFPKELV